jgi:hypothetical protein
VPPAFGHEITVGEHGALGDDLPAISVGALTALRLKGWVTNEREGTGHRVGLGDCSRAVAMKWGMKLSSPEKEAASATTKLQPPSPS